MRISLLELDDPRWPAFLGNVRHDFYHLPAYAKVAARFENGSACAVLAEASWGAILVPLIRRPLPDGRSSRFWDAASPYGYASPLANAVSTASERCPDEFADAVVD